MSEPETPTALSLAVDAVSDAANIDDRVATASRIPGAGLFKRVVVACTGWYVRTIAARVTLFATGAASALHKIAARLERVETQVRRQRERSLDVLSNLPPIITLNPWIPTIVSLIGTPTGRVWVADAVDGELVAALDANGANAYGTESNRAAVDRAVLANREVRHDIALEHCERIPDGALAAVVLAGPAERSAATDALALVEDAARVLMPGGRFVMVSATPEQWDTGASPVLRDLAPGRPFAVETWEHILRTHGFGDITVIEGDGYCMTGVLDGAA